MAIITGPPTTSVSGAGFTGPAEALELVGDHCFAYSGSILNSNTGGANNTALKFTSGNFYAVTNISWVSDSADTGQDEYISIKMNGQTVWEGRFNFADIATNEQPLPFLIPAYTDFELLWGMQSDAKHVTVVLVGRVYRG